MTLQDSYNMLETMSKRFKINGENVNLQPKQRTGSIVSSNPSNLEDSDSIYAMKINELVKMVNQCVKGIHQQQRTASVTTPTKPVNEVLELKRLLNNQGVKLNYN